MKTKTINFKTIKDNKFILSPKYYIKEDLTTREQLIKE